MEYTLVDAAKAAKVNRSTLFRAIKAGRLSARRGDDGSYKVEASELARVYDLQHITHKSTDVSHSVAQGADAPATSAQGRNAGAELASLRAQMVEDQLAREREERRREREDRERERASWDQERETILERERETVGDLRKRLDRAEERVLALTAQPAPRPTLEPPAVVEELRRRLEETEAHLRALVALAPPAPPLEPFEKGMTVADDQVTADRLREEAKAPLQGLELPASQAAQEQPSEPSARVTRPAGPFRGLLGRLLGR